MLHNVAPMTGGIAYAEENRLILLVGLCQCFQSPRIPIHWIMRVFPQVWAGFVDQVIREVRLLVERALRASLEREPGDREIDQALEIYFRHYAEHLLDESKLYPEVEETLAALSHTPKAVVTNKPYQFTVTILERLDVLSHF